MRGKKPRKLFNFVPAEINQALHQGLGPIYDLYPHWAALVGDDLATHSRPLAHVNQCLVVQVDSPVWAAAMRQRQMTVLTRIRNTPGMDQTRDMRIRVAPTPVPVGPAESRPRPAEAISATAADAIARTAVAIDDPGLKQALQRLYSSTSKANKDKS